MALRAAVLACVVAVVGVEAAEKPEAEAYALAACIVSRGRSACH